MRTVNHSPESLSDKSDESDKMEEFEDEIVSVDYILNIRKISTDIQSTTDETLRNL